MKPLKKLASCLFAIMLGASLMAAPAALAFADEASNAAANAISQSPSVSAENLSGEADAAESVSDAAASDSTSESNITTSNESLQTILSGQHVINEKQENTLKVALADIVEHKGEHRGRRF